MQDALVIIPTFNEKDNVLPISEAVLAGSPRFDILFVDDNSPDGTGKILDVMSMENPRVHVLHRTDKQGLGRAYIAGFRWALERHYAFILEMDADFSHAPSDVPALLEAADSAHLVLGSRYVNGIRIINWPLSRLILSCSAALYVRWVTGIPFSDPTGGFKCFRREVLQTIDLGRIHSNGYAFQIEMTHQAWLMGFQIREIPIVFEDRRAGLSKMHRGIVTEALWMTWLMFARCGCRRRPRSSRPAPAPEEGDPLS